MTHLDAIQSPKDQSKVQTTPVAIIGMASIFAKARNLGEYWDNILHKIDCVTEVPASRWNAADYYDPDPAAEDKTYCKRGGFIPDLDFDPAEFGLPPNILEVTDVSQLLGLVVAKDALEDAGYGENREFNRDATGVVLGVVGMSSKLYTPLMARLQYPVWEKVLLNCGLSAEDTRRVIAKIKLAYVGWDENAFPGTIGNVIAGRIANRFDLGGMNCVVDAACASSMAAVRLAVAELIEGRADMMITGGVDTDNSINTYMCFSKTPAFTKGSRVRTFDAASDGMMIGEGLGMIVLKRLADAERDHDRIYAVIKGVGTSSDGRFKSIYAPRPTGQAKAIRRAYAEAGFSPLTVGLLEAHGTGTVAGDPAEFQGMKEVFAEHNPSLQQIALGSVKSQIGHTKSTAGVASLIKISLALYHKVLPATINVTQPNPKFDIKNSPFYINTETRPWMRSLPDVPRRAGVSSFGFGGTNFHVVLEEHEAEHLAPYRLASSHQSVLISASTPGELIAACRERADRLQSQEAAKAYSDLLHESQTTVIPQPHARLGFLSDSIESASHLLQTAQALLQARPDEQSWENPEGIVYRQKGIDPQAKVVALFSGQGSQYVDMGRELAVNFPPVRQVLSQMDQLFLEDKLSPLSRSLFPRPAFEQAEKDAQNELLTRTEHAQPAIGSLSLGMFKLFQAAGFSPDFTAGHSFGELTALCAAGVLDDHDYLSLAKARGKAMAPPVGPHFDAGAMLAVKGDASQIAAEVKSFPRITLANWNSKHQVVLAGARPDIANVQKALKEKGYSVVPLPVSAAFHTRLVGHAQKPFAAAIQSARINAPKCRVYSNTTGKEYPAEPEAIRQVLSDHMLNPVLFKDEIEAIYAEGGRIFVEFGPKNVLTNLVDDILEGQAHMALAINANARKDSDRQLREAALRLCVAGLHLGGIDPYPAVAAPRAVRKKNSITVTLNGGLFVSDKTRKAFEEALQDGFKVNTNATPPAGSLPATTTNEPAQPSAPVPQVSLRTTAALEGAIVEFHNQQNESLRLHEAFLKSEADYGKIFAELTQMEGSLVASAVSGSAQLAALAPILENLERSMMRYHDHQGETLRIHQEYLTAQSETAQRYLDLLLQLAGSPPVQAPRRVAPLELRPVKMPAVPSPMPTQAIQPQTAASTAPASVVMPAAVAPSNGNGKKPQEHAAVGAGFTPAPFAGPTVEAGFTPAPSAGLPAGPTVEAGFTPAHSAGFTPAPFAGPTVEAGFTPAPSVGLPAGPAVGAGFTPAHSGFTPAHSDFTPAPSAGAAPLDVKAISTALLEVVSEKTGYPVEMLDTGMDMEADLGIDSIKRVEILGTMQARFPELPKVEAEVLAELRTLGQISAHLTEAAGTGASPAPVETSTAVTVSIEGVSPATTQIRTAAGVGASPTPTHEGAVNVEMITACLLDVVCEKTGYPVEMLELSMDMEADLGIDSIKRVEILGTVQTRFPELPKVEADVLAELLTLGQIIDFLGGKVGSASAPAAPREVVAPTAVFVNPMQMGRVNLRPLPVPDQIDFTLPQGSICLLTDDGTPAAVETAVRLQESGMKVVVLAFPKEVVPASGAYPEGVLRVQLESLGEEQLQLALKRIEHDYGQPAVFIHLDPSIQNPEATPSLKDAQPGEKAVLKTVFLLAKHLKEPLNQAAALGRAVFMTAVRLDGEFGLGGHAAYEPLSGGLFGLVKTLNLEWSDVFCRALDLSPEIGPTETSKLILAELHDPNRLITEVGYNSHGRFTLVVEPIHLEEVRL